MRLRGKKAVAVNQAMDRNRKLRAEAWMKPTHSKFYYRFAIRLGWVLLAFAIFIGVLLVMYRYESAYDTVRDRLVDTLGLQRAYTIGLARDAARKASVLGAMDAPDRVQSLEELQAKVGEINRTLAGFRGSFDATFLSVRNGTFSSDGVAYDIPRFEELPLKPILNDMNPAWTALKAAVLAVESATELDTDMRKAVIQVTSLSETVLAQSLALNQALLEGLEDRHHRNLATFTMIVMILIALVVALLYGVLHFLVRPLDQLYLRVAEKGVNRQLLIGDSRQLQPVLDDMGKVLDEFRDLMDLIGNVNHSQSFQEILQFIYDKFSRYLPFDYIGIALFRHDEPDVLEAQFGISDGTFTGLPRRMLGLRARVNETTLGNFLLDKEQETRVINDLAGHVSQRPDSDYNRVLLEEGIRSSLTLSLHNQERVLGFLFFSSRQMNAYEEKHTAFLSTVSDALSIAVEKSLFLDELLYSSVLALAKLAEAKDEDTAVHLDRIQQYTTLLCQCLIKEGVYGEELTDTYLRDIIRFSPMHDIGKVGVRDSVLLKPGKLTPEEFEHMKTHATFGANVLQEAENNILKAGRSLFQVGIEIAGGHHEKWNGGGYPLGRREKEIPLSARIVALVDVFDALTSRRPYKEPYAFEQTVDILQEGHGSHFDPIIADCFFLHLDQFRELYNRFVTAQPELFR